MVACNLTALYLDKMLTFRLLPALLLSYGKWTPVIQKQGDEPSLRKKNGKRELIIKIAMLLMGMVCGGWVLLRYKYPDRKRRAGRADAAAHGGDAGEVRPEGSHSAGAAIPHTPPR